MKKLENARLISIAIDNGSIVQLGNLMSCKMFHCSIMICFFFQFVGFRVCLVGNFIVKKWEDIILIQPRYR